MCQIMCDVKQPFCDLGMQAVTSHVGAFSWPQGPGTDTEIRKTWTAGAWNELKALIDAVIAVGGMCSSEGEEFGGNTMQEASAEQPITADIYESARQYLANFGSGGSAASKDGVIYSYFATNLADQFNNGQISTLACDQCNTMCDDCDSCDDCE